MEAIMEFSLVLRELPVNLKDEKGVVKKFTLRELTGEQRDCYLDRMKEKAIFVDGKMTGLKSFKGINETLLSLCLYDEENKLVTEDILKKYPATVLSKLFDAAQKLCALSEEGIAEAKNG